MPGTPFIRLNENPFDIESVNGIPPALAAAKWNAFVDYLAQLKKNPELQEIFDVGPLDITFSGPTSLMSEPARKYKAFILAAIDSFNKRSLELYGIPNTYTNDKGEVIPNILTLRDILAAQRFHKKTDPNVAIAPRIRNFRTLGPSDISTNFERRTYQEDINGNLYYEEDTRFAFSDASVNIDNTKEFSYAYELEQERETKEGIKTKFVSFFYNTTINPKTGKPITTIQIRDEFNNIEEIREATDEEIDYYGKLISEQLNVTIENPDITITPQIESLVYPVPLIRPFYKETENPVPPSNYQGTFEIYKVGGELAGNRYRVKLDIRYGSFSAQEAGFDRQQVIVNKERFEEIRKQFLLEDLSKKDFFERIKSSPKSSREFLISDLASQNGGEYIPFLKEWGIINPDGSYNYSVFNTSSSSSTSEKKNDLIYYYPKETLPIAQSIAIQNKEIVAGYEIFTPETVIPVVWGNKRFIISQDDYSANLGGISELDPSSEYGSLSKNWWEPAEFFKSFDLELDIYKDKLPWVTLNKEYLTTFSPFPEWVDAGRASFIPKIDPTKINDLTRDYYDDAVSRLSAETKLSKSILPSTPTKPSVDTSTLDEGVRRLDTGESLLR